MEKSLRQEYTFGHGTKNSGFFRKTVEGDSFAFDVTSQEWIFLQIDLHEGTARLSIEGDTHTVRSGSYGFFVPPFSIYHFFFAAGRADMRVFYSFLPKPEPFPESPFFFRWQSRPFEGNFSEIVDAMNAADEFLYPDTEIAGNDLARRIKESIDGTFETACPLSDLADSLGISAAHFSRVFKRRYGLTAVDYRGRLRSVRAAYKLIGIERGTVSDVAFDTGYSDLSRFNKQFRRHVKMAPGAIRKLRRS